MIKKLFFMVVFLLICISLLFSGCQQEKKVTQTQETTAAETQETTAAETQETTAAETQETTAAETQEINKQFIKIGTPLQLSGWAVGDAELAHKWPYELWVKQVNEKGGLIVKGSNKSIPIEFIEYDTESDIAKTVRMAEKLIVEDKVDIILPPWATAFNFAVAPIINQYKYPMIGTTESSSQLLMACKRGEMSYYFGMWNPPDVVAPAVVEILKETGIKSVAVIFVGTLYGIDQSAVMTRLLGLEGIEIKLVESYPLGVTDLSPLLKKVKSLNPEALLAISYPQDAMLIQEQMQVIDFNPKLFYNSLSGYPQQRDKMGKEAVEGMISEGAWNKDFGPGSPEFYDAFVSAFKAEPAWDTVITYASLQIWEEVLANVGLDREKQRDYIANTTFNTIYGKVKFTDQYNIPTGDPEGANPPILGQWQNGVFEVIWPKDLRKKPLIFPKPEWPK